MFAGSFGKCLHLGYAQRTVIWISVQSKLVNCTVLYIIKLVVMSTFEFI